MGDVIKAGFPVPGFAARALGGHDQLQWLGGIANGLGAAGHQVVGLAAIDRDAAQPAHERTEGPAKDAGFAHPTWPQLQSKGHHQRHGQVPVAGMRGSDQHAFLSVCGQLAQDLPAAQLQNADGQPLEQGADQRGGENGVLHGVRLLPILFNTVAPFKQCIQELVL